MPDLSSHPVLLGFAAYALGALATLTVDSLARRGTPYFWQAPEIGWIITIIAWPAFLLGFGVGLCLRFLNTFWNDGGFS